MGSAQRYLCESGSENGKVETKGSYSDVVFGGGGSHFETGD